MYEKFYGLNEKPFQILSDPAYLFMSKAHESAYTHLEYGILENKGFVVITGEIGSGKTTLINYLLDKIEGTIQTALINNTLVKPGQLIKMLCQDFEIDIRGLDEAELLTAFYQFLIEQYKRRKRVILIIDEAQNLSIESLEEIRMLSNFEMDKQHLFQIILVGQPELRLKLQRKTLEQLAQRVSVHYHISGLGPEEVDAYIKYRMQIAGSKNPDVFMPDALEAIYAYSRGIPRLINILCDTALVYGYADGLKTIGREVIESVIQEREVGGFKDFTETGGREPSLPEGGNTVPTAAQDSSWGRRVADLEARLEGLERKVDLLSGGGGYHDALIGELFKLLQENLRGRYVALSQLMRQDSGGESSPSNEGIAVQRNLRFRF